MQGLKTQGYANRSWDRQDARVGVQEYIDPEVQHSPDRFLRAPALYIIA